MILGVSENTKSTRWYHLPTCELDVGILNLTSAAPPNGAKHFVVWHDSTRRESIQGGKCETSNAIRCRRVCRCLLSDRFPSVVNQPAKSLRENAGKGEVAMAQLNYIPNRVAQQLAGKQSLLIGVCYLQSGPPAPPSQIVAAIKSRADQLGASVVVSMVERSSVEACKAAVHNLLAQRVSGLIINYPLDDEDAIAVEAACA